MEALQILVLPVQVRILVGQLTLLFSLMRKVTKELSRAISRPQGVIKTKMEFPWEYQLKSLINYWGIVLASEIAGQKNRLEENS